MNFSQAKSILRTVLSTAGLPVRRDDTDAEKQITA